MASIIASTTLLCNYNAKIKNKPRFLVPQANPANREKFALSNFKLLWLWVQRRWLLDVSMAFRLALGGLSTHRLSKCNFIACKKIKSGQVSGNVGMLSPDKRTRWTLVALSLSWSWFYAMYACIPLWGASEIRYTTKLFWGLLFTTVW